MKKKDILILIGAIAAALALAITQFSGGTVATGAWGLHFSEAGQAPQGPATQAELAKYDAVYRDTSGKKVLYLTFDAGYENGCTERILDTLKKHRVPAAFFLVGNYLEKNGDLVRRMVDEGHIVGNHTMHHRDMRTLTDREAFSKELTDVEELFRELTGKELPKFYRPPQGVYSEENLRMAQEMGYQTVFWSLAYADWRNDAQPTAQEAINKLLPRTHDGAVILLHSTSETNAQVLDQLLGQWKQLGYRFASLEELTA